LSAADSTLLAHLDERVSVRPTALARHLGVSPSTLSAAVKRLTAHGYIVRQRPDGDGRVRDLRLSKSGVAAMQAASVLESSRVRAMLARLTALDRERALAGLALLAAAARNSGEER
jgi:DNA-binding MarR family transcriptional regulator